MTVSEERLWSDIREARTKDSNMLVRPVYSHIIVVIRLFAYQGYFASFAQTALPAQSLGRMVEFRLLAPMPTSSADPLPDGPASSASSTTSLHQQWHANEELAMSKLILDRPLI